MVYKKQYSWGRGYSPKVDAETVGGVVEKIEERDGVVTRESFLDESRPDDSPTHKLFEWNDAIAAEKWRLSTARKTLDHLKVTVFVEDTNTESEVSAYVNVSTEKGASYINVYDALSKKETRDVVLNRAINELHSFQRKYETLTELSHVFDAINELEA